jgi:hypothetical protein
MGGVMVSEKQIRDKIKEINDNYHHVLHVGGCADVWTNAPRALMQCEAEAKLAILHWCLGEKFIHKYPRKMNT